MDSFKLINDFLTFNGRLEKKPFIRRYLIVFLLTYALMTIGRAINMPLLVAASSVFVIPQLVGLIIPLVSLVSLVFLCWGKSDPYRNQFG